MNSAIKFVLASMGAAVLTCGLPGCEPKPPQYGTERPLNLTPGKRQVWAIAPAINLSGQQSVDPLLQADLVYQQLQAVHGVTAIPVNRVAEVYASLRVEKVQSAEQAAIVCELLGCDGLIVPTITAYDPYEPPKFGASLQLFGKPGNFDLPPAVDPRDLVRQAAPPPGAAAPPPVMASSGAIAQSVGMFDSANGSVRQSLLDYAVGRADPVGPLGSKEYFVSMDRYCGFAYHELIAGLVRGSTK